jgi:hypothetical protein
MLPKDLLEVRKYKGKMFPRFAGEREYPLAEQIIGIFKAGKGKKYGSIMAALKKVENARNYRKVRGFVRVIENFCIEKVCPFDVSHLDPVKVRLYLFERGYVTSKKDRQQVIELAARYFRVSPMDVEKVMFADMDEELVVAEVREISPDELIRLYNLSLLQTAIFNCLRLTFWTSSNHKEIFRRIKWLGLMYELYEEEGKDEEGKILISVTGAASILKMTRKYGTSIAKLIPSILKADEWWIRAEILDENTNRIYLLELDYRQGHLFPEYDERIEFDSSLEEEFERKVRAITGAEVIREPDVIKAGRYAFIPDFLVRRGEKEVYVEIVGFWTEEYLKKKMEKIRQVNVPLIVIAREEYGKEYCSKKRGIKADEDVIFFSTKIPYNEVIRRINLYLRADISEMSFDMEEKEVIHLKELAEEYGVSVNEVAEKLPKDYVLAGAFAIKKEILDEIAQKLEEIKPEKLADAASVLERYGVGYEVLPVLGYRIKWVGLSEEDAIVVKELDKSSRIE